MNLANHFAIGVLADEPDPRIFARGLLANMQRAIAAPEARTVARYQEVGAPKPGTQLARILDTIAKSGETGIAAREISERLDYDESLIHGSISTLNRRGFVVRMPDTNPKRYRRAARPT